MEIFIPAARGVEGARVAMDIKKVYILESNDRGE